MYDSSAEPCCMAHVTSGGRDEHEPGCPQAWLARQLAGAPPVTPEVSSRLARLLTSIDDGPEPTQPEERTMARIFSVRFGDVARCPRRSLAARHYREDGSCRCDGAGS